MTVADNPKQPKFGFTDNPDAPDIFADGVTGIFLLGGNLRVTLETLRASHTKDPGLLNRVPVARLVMPTVGAEALARKIIDFVENQRGDAATAAQTTTKLQ